MKHRKNTRDNRFMNACLIVAMAILIAGCGGGGGGGTASTSTTPGTQPTGIPGAPINNTAAPAYASSTTNFCMSLSVDSNCWELFINGVQSAGPNNTQLALSKCVTLQEGLNNLVLQCKNAQGQAGGTTSVGPIVLDTAPPPAPTLQAAVASNSPSPVSISLGKTLDSSVDLKVNNGAWSTSPVVVADTFDNSNYNTLVTRTYSQALASGVNSLEYRARDRAGNYSTGTLIISVTCTGTTCTGAGGGTTNPNAPTISCSHSTNALTLTSACTISGAGCTSASMSWGDGTTNTDLTCSGGTYSHTYSGAGTFTTVATVNAAGGSNTYTQSMTVSGIGGSFSASYGTSVSANGLQGPIATNDTDIAYMIGTNGGVTAWLAYKYNSQSNVWNLVRAQKLDNSGETPNLSFTLSSINDIAVCSTNRVYMSSGNAIYRFSMGDNAITYLGSITNLNLSSPRGMDCDSGTLYVANSGANNVLAFNTASFDLIGTIGGSSTLNDPRDLTLIGSSLYILNRGGDNVHKFSTSGTDEGIVTSNIATGTGIDSVTINGVTYLVISDEGGREVFGYSLANNIKVWSIGSSQFSAPQGVVVIGGLRKIAVSDTGSSSIKILDF